MCRPIYQSQQPVCRPRSQPGTCQVLLLSHWPLRNDNKGSSVSRVLWLPDGTQKNTGKSEPISLPFDSTRFLPIKYERHLPPKILARQNKPVSICWIGHILRSNCLLQRVTEGKIQEEIEVTGRQGRRHRKLLDDLKERRGYSHLKEEALDRTIWRARFGRGFGPVVRQTTK